MIELIMYYGPAEGFSDTGTTRRSGDPNEAQVAEVHNGSFILNKS